MQAEGILGQCVVDERNHEVVLEELTLIVCSLIPVNSATQIELEVAPNIGTSKAQAIIAGRPWASITALSQVSGIGASNTIELGNWNTI